MTVSLTHAKEATLPDDPNYEVGSTEWNEQHVLTQATARLLGRTTAGTGPTEEITVGSGLSLAGGELTATGGGTGTVTSVSVVSANGLAGTVATATTTPAITLTTSITGVLKGNGTAISAATPSVDYTVPSDLAAYLTTANAASTYQTIAGMSSYLTTAAAAAAYQPLDPDLTSIAGLGGNGFPARTAANTYTLRSLAGTASRISVTNPAGVAGNPTLDIDAAYVGQTSITTLGTIGTGVWNGTVIIGTYGGTGVNNSTRTMTYAGNVAFTGAFNPTFASSASVTHTLPGVAGTLATLAGTEAFTNKTYNGNTWTAGTGTLTIAAGKTLTGSNSITLAGTDSTTMTFPPASASIGYINIPQNSQTSSYQLVAADAGKHVYVPSGTVTVTIPANGTVAFATGTAITFVNYSATAVTIAITTDTLRLAGAGTTGSRTLAQYGTATALKVDSTNWIISGTNLT